MRQPRRARSLRASEAEGGFPGPAAAAEEPAGARRGARPGQSAGARDVAARVRVQRVAEALGKLPRFLRRRFSGSSPSGDVRSRRLS